MKLLIYALTFCSGAALAVQVGVNTELRRHLGNGMHAALASFSMGTLAALLYCLLAWEKVAPARQVASAPWWAWTGGILGVLYVWTAIFCAPRIGAAAVFGLMVAGQLITALLLDHFGALGLPGHPLTLPRLVGVALVIAGAGLYVRA